MSNWRDLKAALEGKRVVTVERGSDYDATDGQVYTLSLLLADGVKVTFEADGAYDAVWINYEVEKGPLLRPKDKKK